MTDKMPPQNIESEIWALGSVLVDRDEPEALIKLMEMVMPDEFYRDAHQSIYGAMIDCYQLGEQINVLTVADRLKSKGELEKAGGAHALAQMTSEVPTAANIRYHARQIKEKALQRRVILWANELSNQAHSGVEDQRQWFADIQRGIIQLSDTVKERKSPHIADILKDLDDQWEEFSAAKKDKDNKNGKYCECALMKSFNSESPIPYHMPGHLIMLAGYTSAGKSTALAQIIVDACRRGSKCLTFSLEEGRTTKAAKMIANLTDIPQRYLLTGEIDSKDSVIEAKNILKQWGLMFYDDVRTLDEIVLKTKKHVMQGGVDIVAIDYVQNIQGDGSSIYNDMRLIGPTLLDMAGDLGVNVIALSQVNNESMRDDSQIIGLKGAGEFAAAADIVLWLKRKKGDPYALDCDVKKNRPFGITGTVELKFSDRYTRIERRF